MGGVDTMDQKAAAYKLDCKSKYPFYLRMLLDLTDVPIVNGHIVHTKLGNDILLLSFKIVLAKALVGRHSNRKSLFPISRPSKRKSHELSMARELRTNMPEFQDNQMKCHYCNNENSDH